MIIDLGWNVQTALDISSATERRHPIAPGTVALIVDSESDVYLKFDTTNDNTIDAAKDIRWLANNSVTPIRIPAKLKGQIYLHVKQITSEATKKCRIVEL